MRVLVTGGFGLVGREVVTALCAEGHAVRVLDSSRAAVPRPYRRTAGLATRTTSIAAVRMCCWRLPGERRLVRGCVRLLDRDLW